jgi:hypothetical protein
MKAGTSALSGRHWDKVSGAPYIAGIARTRDERHEVSLAPLTLQTVVECQVSSLAPDA